MGPGGLGPAAEVFLPSTGPLVRRFGRDEPRKNRSFRFPSRQGYDRRQHTFHPWRFPKPFLGKNALHIDAKMDAALGQGQRQQSV